MCQRRQWLDEQGLPEQEEPYDDEQEYDHWLMEQQRLTGRCVECGAPLKECRCSDEDF